MSPTDPIRLGLELNLAVFYYEVMKDIEKALEFAKDAYDDAIAELDEEYHDDLNDTDETDALDSNGNSKHGVRSTLKLLKEKLSAWELKNTVVQP